MLFDFYIREIRITIQLKKRCTNLNTAAKSEGNRRPQICHCVLLLLMQHLKQEGQMCVLSSCIGDFELSVDGEMRNQSYSALQF